MLIEYTTRRADGSTIRLDGVEYKFLPGEDKRHVCEVTDKGHIETLLAHPKLFRAVGKDAKPVKVAEKVAEPVVDAAPVVEPQAPADEPQEPAEKPADDDRAAWVKQYEAKYGRKPHHKWSVERIRAEVEAQ